MYDNMRKSNVHLFVSFTLIMMYGERNVKAMDCWDYMETISARLNNG